MAEQGVEEVVFYSWIGWDDKEKRAFPSQTTHNISGGQVLVAKDGTRVNTPLKEARFHNGICRTSDPEIIEKLRAVSGREQITEDKEKYYDNVLTANQRAQREKALNSGLRDRVQTLEEELQQSLAETSRLRDQLESQGKAQVEGKKQRG